MACKSVQVGGVNYQLIFVPVFIFSGFGVRIFSCIIAMKEQKDNTSVNNLMWLVSKSTRFQLNLLNYSRNLIAQEIQAITDTGHYWMVDNSLQY